MYDDEAEAKCRAHFNEIGVYGGMFVVRVVGFLNAIDEDYYWITRDEDGTKGYQSMVGGFDPVHGEYTSRNWAERSPPESEFLVEVE